MPSDIAIRPAVAADRAQWEPLWAGYLDFYQKRIPAETTERAWKRIIESGEILCLLAFDPAGRAVGLAHYFFHPSIHPRGDSCYLQDLFVAPDARNHSIGRRLIAAVADQARGRNTAVLYWQTEEFNGAARRLYERISKRSPFIRYQIEL